MRLAVNPTRMELQRLKKRLVLAHRGHKLLKDKQDELMRQFMSLVKAIKGLRQKVEEGLEGAFRSFTLFRARLAPQEAEEALALPSKRVNLQVEEKPVMNLRVPVFTTRVEGRMRCYGFYNTNSDLDRSLRELEKVLEKMLQLAQAEKTLGLLAQEIERTRRRVNALEYILIPSLQETIKYIDMKLSEMERGNLTRLMKIKEMLAEV